MHSGMKCGAEWLIMHEAKPKNLSHSEIHTPHAINQVKHS